MRWLVLAALFLSSTAHAEWEIEMTDLGTDEVQRFRVPTTEAKSIFLGGWGCVLAEVLYQNGLPYRVLTCIENDGDHYGDRAIVTTRCTQFMWNCLALTHGPVKDGTRLEVSVCVEFRQ